MTALTKYDRLEATGLWRETPDARLREVVVGLRNTTLLLTDPRTEQPITQWSLPAIRRLGPADDPAVFAPSDDGAEVLELTDPEMIAALGKVRRVLERRKSRPGRLRLIVTTGAALSIVGLLVFVLPGQLVDYTASVIPVPARADLGRAGLDDLARLTGSPCNQPAGQSAADGLAHALFGDNPPRIVVLRDALAGPRALPGPIMAIPQSALDAALGPEEIAGALLVERARDPGDLPLHRLLDHAGLFATLRLLTTGEMSPDAVQGFGAELLADPVDLAPLTADPARLAQLIAAFRDAGMSTLPWAEPRAKGTGAEADLARALLAADPFPEGGPKPVLDDGDWLMLQSICG